MDTQTETRKQSTLSKKPKGAGEDAEGVLEAREPKAPTPITTHQGRCKEEDSEEDSQTSAR